MLHILWMLIKIILIVLGTVLGLAVLFLCLLLFCPVRYKARVLKTQGSLRNLEAQFTVSWLFGGVRLSLLVSQTKKVRNFRLFGIPVLKFVHKWKRRKRSIRKADTEKTIPQKPHPESVHSSENSEDVQRQEPFHEETSAEKSRKTAANKILLFLEKLKEIPGFLLNILYSLKKISLTMQNIYDKINYWKQFLENQRVQSAFALAKQQLKKLLFHVFPRKVKGSVTFGSEDPSVTGAVLALLGMTFPLHQNRVSIQPVFENRNFFEGNISLKGRIYGIVPLMVFIKLYFDKNIKYVIYRWKNKEV